MLRMVTTQILDSMLGFPQQQQSVSMLASPYGNAMSAGDWQSRLEVYGKAVAPLTVTYPAVSSYAGRNDPTAQLAQSLSKRTQNRVDRRAMKDLSTGKNGGVDQRSAKAKWASSSVSLRGSDGTG